MMPDLEKRPFLSTLTGSNSLKAPSGSMAAGGATVSDIEAALRAAAANGGEGWLFAQDAARLDRSNALQISANVRTRIPIDGLGASTQTDFIDTIPRPQVPEQIPLITGGTINAAEVGDFYFLRFNFFAALIGSGLTSSQDQASILVEFNVDTGAFTFNVHVERNKFDPDPGVLRREWQQMEAARLDILSLASSINAIPIIGGALSFSPANLISAQSAQEARVNSAVAAMTANGTQFIDPGFYFAGQELTQFGVNIFVTPTHDVELWKPDIVLCRLSSPTT